MTTRRSAFTLLELLLVLAVIVIIGALTVPSIGTPMENQRLRKGAELIRSQWSQARVQAMKSGRIHLFRFETGGNRFFVEPWAGVADDMQSTNDQALEFGHGLVTSQGASGPQELPDGVLFAQGQSSSDSRAAAMQQNGGNAPSGEGLSAGNSPPVLFYPDGTTSNSRLLLTNRRERFVLIDLRGLTGLSQVSDLLTRQDLGRIQ